MAAWVGHAVITGPDEAVTLAWRPLTHGLCWRPLLATAVGNLSWQPLTHDLSLIHDPNTPKKTGDASVPMGDHDDSKEIQQNLEEYEGQLVELRALLKESDEDAADEIQAVIKDLEEAVELSKELLETAKQRERDRAASHTATESSAPGRAGTRRIEAAITEAPEVKAPAVLGAKVKQQLRERQQRAALEGITDNLWMAAIGCVHTRVGQVSRHQLGKWTTRTWEFLNFAILIWATHMWSGRYVSSWLVPGHPGRSRVVLCSAIRKFGNCTRKS